MMAKSMVDTMHEGGDYRRIEVITGRRQRRDWPVKEKARIVAESFEAGVNISDVARRNGVSRGLLGVWRRQARESGACLAGQAMFATVRLEDGCDRHEESVVPAQNTSFTATRAIEVGIGDATIRVPRGADRATLDIVIAALRGMR